jgi:hypothetical protein
MRASLCMLAVLHAASVGDRPATFSVAIDVSGATAVLAAAVADPAHAAGAAQAALRNDAVRAMIAKMAKYDSTVTPAAFEAAVVRLAAGGSGAPFDLDRLRTDPASTRRMLARLTTDSAAIARRLADRLRSFTPDNVDVHATLFVVVGAAHQNGWVPNEQQANFYLDLGFHGEELESVINIASHELFHVVQGMVQPNIDSAMTDRPDLAIDARGRHRARAVLLNLVVEGMADYVGDPSLYPSAGPHLARDQQELARELARAGDIFALFETILYRARRDPDAPLATLLKIGFGGSWNQTGYYVGYRMAKAIDRYAGRERLRALVALPPADFVTQYAQIAAAHPADPDITPLAPASIATVEELESVNPNRGGYDRVDAVTLYPLFAEYYTCAEHYLGQLPGLGDALGADCSIVVDGSNHQGSGERNEDYYGWNKPVLAPFDGVVESVFINPVVNQPGTMGTSRSSSVTFLRSDGVRVLYGHVQDVTVSAGDHVTAGQPFARVGNNGFATGPHTHVGAWRDNTPLQIRWDLAGMAQLRAKR